MFLFHTKSRDAFYVHEMDSRRPGGVLEVGACEPPTPRPPRPPRAPQPTPKQERETHVANSFYGTFVEWIHTTLLNRGR